MKESESERKKEKNEVFVKKESYGEYKEVREIKGMKKEKKIVGNFWGKWKGRNTLDG